MFEKDFKNWFLLKPKLHNLDKQKVFFRERDVWWCSIGCNVGDEQDGKSNKFNRPVLIIKKFNRNLFYGLPMSTQIKNNRYYFAITFQERTVSVLLSQMRVLDKKRLQRKIGQLDEGDFNKVVKEYTGMFRFYHPSEISEGIDG